MIWLALELQLVGSDAEGILYLSLYLYLQIVLK